jgi:hypothetical protein
MGIIEAGDWLTGYLPLTAEQCAAVVACAYSHHNPESGTLTLWQGAMQSAAEDAYKVVRTEVERPPNMLDRDLSIAVDTVCDFCGDINVPVKPHPTWGTNCPTCEQCMKEGRT